MAETLSKEFNNEFDLLYNNIASNQAPGLDIYEKSVFLTNAQDEIVLSIYSKNGVDGESFENTEEARRYLDSIIKTWVSTIHYGYYFNSNFYTDAAHTLLMNGEDRATFVDKSTGNNYKCSVSTATPPVTSYTKLTNRIESSSYLISLPSDLWFITYEAATINSTNSCLSGKEFKVIPVTQDEYHSVKNNPFRGATNNRILRLDSGDKQVELVSKNNVQSYKIRYIEKLSPIVLDNITGLSIRGESSETTCKLNSSLHRAIINRAVKLAIASMAQTIQ